MSSGFTRESAPISQSRKIAVYTRVWRTSGSGLFAQELVLALVKCGKRVIFVCPRIDDPRIETPRPDLSRIRPMREQSSSLKPVRMLTSLARILGGGWGLLVARLAARTIIVSIPDPLPFTVPLLALLRLTGARIVLVVHDPLPHAFRLPTQWQWIEIELHRLCYTLASAIVVLSEPTRTELRKLFPNLRCPVEVIDHGVFPLKACAPPPGTGRLLAFGTIRRNKRVIEAIEGTIRAHRAGHPVSLLVAGEVHRELPEYARACQRIAATAPDVVEVRIGYIDDAELTKVVGQSDALLMPYADFHSQSGVALLAASNARPIIATRAGGLATLLDEGMPASIIADPVSAGSVADAIEHFFAEPISKWHDQAVTYQRFTMERRSWVAIARKFITLVEWLPGSVPPGIVANRASDPAVSGDRGN